MKYLKFQAAQTYLNITRDSYFLHLIDWGVFLDRIAVLKDLCQGDTVIHEYAKNILTMEEWTSNSCLQDDDRQKPYDSNITGNDNSNYNSQIEPDDDCFCFRLIINVPGLNKWCFHPHDDDYFPSIPHGHWEAKSQPKLDPYLGWVYQGSRQIRRESRKNIINLWNNDDFRKLAIIAIDYYTSKHEHYSGLRVKNRRRLPRKRY